MNKEEMTGMVLSWHTPIANGHEPRLYTYIGSEVPLGEYEAILDFKIWAKKTIGISCYFTQIQTSKKFQLTVYCNFQSGSYKISGSDPGDQGQWRLIKLLAGGGPLIDLGVYCIQSSRYVLSEEPIAVTAEFGPVLGTKLFSQVEESISWQLEFSGGAVCNSTSSYGYIIDRFFATADEGQFELSPELSHGPFIGKTSKGPLNIPSINQQATQLDEIGKLILENKMLPTHITGEEGIKDIKIVEAVYKAARTGKKIRLV